MADSTAVLMRRLARYSGPQPSGYEFAARRRRVGGQPLRACAVRGRSTCRAPIPCTSVFRLPRPPNTVPKPNPEPSAAPGIPRVQQQNNRGAQIRTGDLADPNREAIPPPGHESPQINGLVLPRPLSRFAEFAGDVRGLCSGNAPLPKRRKARRGRVHRRRLPAGGRRGSRPRRPRPAAPASAQPSRPRMSSAVRLRANRSPSSIDRR